MKNILLLSLFCFFIITNSNAQLLKVAILDFENTSGIAKYDGLGKAMSSMLITDIESNVSPKRLQLVERAQIQKILKEQNFQSTSAVDKTTTVKAGKILGVKYLLVGDIYILNDVLVINARLTDTETGDIKFSKKQEGKLSTWLMLKTNIAKELALSISMSFTEPNIPDKEMNVATITTFGNAVVAKDEGKIEKAEMLINSLKEIDSDFKYVDYLKRELEILKAQVAEQGKKIEKLSQSDAFQNEKIASIDSRFAIIEKRILASDFVANPVCVEDYLVNAMTNYRNADYGKAEPMFEKVFREGYYKYDLVYMYYDVLLNNYDADTGLIRKKLDEEEIFSKSIFFKLVEMEYTVNGTDYYIQLSKINIPDSVLKAFMENIRCKSFYIDVQKDTEMMPCLINYWSDIFLENKTTLGLKIIKTKKMFFDYPAAYKRYISNTSYSGDDNTVFDFYKKVFKNLDNTSEKCKKEWLEFCRKSN